MMRKKTVKQPKQVIIIARVSWKLENKVCYLVRSSTPLKDGSYRLKPGGVVEQDGEEYQSVVRDGERYLVYRVSLLNGDVTGCTCPAHKFHRDCYIKQQIALIEAARPATVPTLPVIETAQTTTEHTAEDEDEIEAMIALCEKEAASLAVKTLPTATQTVQNNLTTAQPASPGERGSLNSDRRQSVGALVSNRHMTSIEASLPSVFFK